MKSTEYFYENEQLHEKLKTSHIVKLLQSNALLMKHYAKNSAEIQLKFIEHLIGPTYISDCPGFIYGFKQHLKHIENPFASHYSIKIGRTKNQIPQTRIFQWQKQDNTQYVQIFTFRSQNNRKLQTLIHLIFSYARKVRQINGKTRIQWFFFQQKVFHAAVTQMVDALMQEGHRMSDSILKKGMASNSIQDKFIPKEKQYNISKSKQVGRVEQDVIMFENKYEEFIKSICISLPLSLSLSNKNSSLKQLYKNVLQQLQLKQSFQTIVFNRSPQSFYIDISLKLHSQFIIIFARNICISQQNYISFQIHYCKRRPIQIRMILIAQEYQEIDKLKINDHRYGKILIVKVNRNDKKYHILDEYFSQKKNQIKLGQLLINDLLKAYFLAYQIQ